MMLGSQLGENWEIRFSTCVQEKVISDKIWDENQPKNQGDSHPIPKNHSTLAITI